MTIKYCDGSARKAETIFGWGRANVQLGLHEKRTGITCLGAQSAFGGRKLWEEEYPEVAATLWKIAESHSQQDPTFRTTFSYTRLTAAEALKQLRKKGFSEKELPCPRTMADVLNRNGYKLRSVLKAGTGLGPFQSVKIPQHRVVFLSLKTHHIVWWNSTSPVPQSQA